MVVLGATGSILAFEPELDRLLHPRVSHVNPGGRVLSLVELGEAVSRKYPGEAIIAYLPSTRPNLPSQVILSRGIVSVNQYDGEVLGVRTRGQTFLGFVRALHVRLAMGTLGRKVVKWSAAVMMFSLASGLYLWWPHKRVRIRGPLWSRGFWFDCHNVIGIFSLVPLLMLAASGSVMGFEDEVSSLLNGIASPRKVQTPLVALRPDTLPSPGAILLTPDQAVAIARSQVPGAIPNRVQMPQYGGRYVVDLENSHPVVDGRNSVAIDSRNGAILSASLAVDLSLRERVMAWNEAIHEGDAFGLPGRIVVSVACILLPLQGVSGLVLWLLRPKVAHSNESR